MKRLLVVLALLGVVGGASAFKGGATPGPAGTYLKSSSLYHLFSGTFAPAGTLTVAATVYGGSYVPQATTITNAGGYTVTAGGTGTGKMQITDGTNTCDCSYTCTLASGSAFTNACANVAGTGCTYAAGATLKLVWGTTAACTTTQPTFNSYHLYGTYN